MTPPPRSGNALAFVEIKVTDWPGMVRWYSDTLGLAPVLEDRARQFALLDAGPARVALKGDGSSELELARDAVRLVFEVADLDAECDRLARLGLAVGPVEVSPEGYRAVRLRDPEGTPITLYGWISGKR